MIWTNEVNFGIFPYYSEESYDVMICNDEFLIHQNIILIKIVFRGISVNKNGENDIF